MSSESDDALNNFAKAWMDMATGAMQAWRPITDGIAASGSTASPEVLRNARYDLLQVWNDWCDSLLRSAAFLDAQKRGARSGLALRKAVRATVRRMQVELQIAGREDIEALMAALRRAQDRILDELDDNARRLQTLESKIDRLADKFDAMVSALGAVVPPSHPGGDNNDSPGESASPRRRRRSDPKD